MKYLKLAIWIFLAGFTAYVCLWPMYDDIAWFSNLVDPMVQPMLTVVGIFAIIALVCLVLSRL